MMALLEAVPWTRSGLVVRHGVEVVCVSSMR